MSGNEAGRPAWNEERAGKLIGATVLIGITRLRSEGSDLEQMFGVIISADAKDGFKIELQGSRLGETYWLPPDLRNFHAARPGEYHLRSTGETISNPEYTSTWTISAPAH